jgi:hypothetical protein
VDVKAQIEKEKKGREDTVSSSYNESSTPYLSHLVLFLVSTRRNVDSIGAAGKATQSFQS